MNVIVFVSQITMWSIRPVSQKLSSVTKRRRKMKDLSRESVEYVCTRFRSPNIARKYGHKIYSDYQDPYLSAMQRALSVVRLWMILISMKMITDDICNHQDPTADYESSPSPPPPQVPVRPTRGCDEVRNRKQALSWQEGDYQLYCKSLSHSTADQHNRDLIRKVKSLN